MAVKFDIKLDGRFVKEAKGRIERFWFEVGVLDEGIHKMARPSSAGLKSYAGGPARKTSRKPDGLTMSELSIKLREQSGVNFYTAPFKAKKNIDIVRFTNSFMKMITEGGKLKEKKRLENHLQAIVRNPILRGDYGRNSDVTEKIKGFNRFMIDTAQFFKAITARVRIKSVS